MCVGKKIKIMDKLVQMLNRVSPIVANVSAMSSGGFRTTHYQNTTNDNRKYSLTK